jgi:hypothetical protein
MWWNHTFVVFGANCEHIVSLHEASCPSTNDELLERSVLTYACTASVILTDVNVKYTLDVIFGPFCSVRSYWCDLLSGAGKPNTLLIIIFSFCFSRKVIAVFLPKYCSRTCRIRRLPSPPPQFAESLPSWLFRPKQNKPLNPGFKEAPIVLLSWFFNLAA